MTHKQLSAVAQLLLVFIWKLKRLLKQKKRKTCLSEAESVWKLLHLWSSVEGVFQQFRTLPRVWDKQRWEAFYALRLCVCRMSRLQVGYESREGSSQASDWSNHPHFSYFGFLTYSVGLLNCIYYLQTVSIPKFPPRGRLTQNKNMDSDSAVNELPLQIKGIVVCEPNARFSWSLLDFALIPRSA